MSQLLAFLAVIVIIVAVVWGTARLATVIYKDTAPRQMEAEREVYMNTPSYINSKNQVISGYIMQYKKATNDQDRQVIRQQIVDEAATVDQTKLTPQVQSFLKNL